MWQSVRTCYLAIATIMNFEFSSAYTICPAAFNMNRRALFETACSSFTIAGVSAVAVPPPAQADFIGPPPMIKSWPGLQYLVPIYELDNSLALLASQLDPAKGAKGVKVASRLVDNFFQGGLISNKNVYKGLCTIYVQEIQYDDPDKDWVRQSRISFLDDCDLTINSLQSMQKPLKNLVKEEAEVASAEVLASLETARSGVRSFLSRVPQQDLGRIKTWVKNVAAADVDRNGKVEGEELNSLSSEDQVLYKSVGDFLGV